MIAITGVGVISAIGCSYSEFGDALQKGVCGIRDVCYLPTRHRELQVGEVPLSNAELHERLRIPFSASRSRTELLGALALREAVTSAQLSVADLQTCALVSGTTVANMDIVEHMPIASEPLTKFGNCEQTTHTIAALVSDFAFTTTVSTACSAAANTFILGANLLRSGKHQRVVVGGAEALSLFHLNGFRSLQILDAQPCRPFDKERRGINLGEGAAYFVLESVELALARKVKPLAILRGWGNACDAFHQTASSEQGDGAYLAMQQAITRAKLQPTDIDYINAHGTGTQNNDASEASAIQRLFGELIPPFSSTKAMTGHATSASGALEMAVCLQALQHGFLPPNLHFQTPEPSIPLTPVRETEYHAHLEHILCNSFGFGGNDTSLVLSRWHEEHRQQNPCFVSPSRPVYLKAFDRFATIPPDKLPKLPPLVARRLGGVLRRGLQTSLAILKRVGVEHPDAIIVGSADGCVEETAAFLHSIINNAEDALSPTPFIYSTYNTLASLIAIHTRTHSYNTTYSHGAHSLYSALLDALLQIRLGDIQNALVGLHDNEHEVASVYFLDTNPEGALCDFTSVDELLIRYPPILPSEPTQTTNG